MILQKVLYTQNQVFAMAVAIAITTFTKDATATLMSYFVKLLVTMTETARVMLLWTILTSWAPANSQQLLSVRFLINVKNIAKAFMVI